MFKIPIQQRDTTRYYNYLDLFFQQSQDPISVFDLDDKIVTINPAFEELYGWKLEECLGKVIRFYPDTELESVRARCELLKKGESLNSVQVIEKRKDGTCFHAEITMAPIFNEHNEVVAISNITRDITLRLQAEAYALEIERLRTTSNIAAVVAHEIRNPMTAITGFVQMMNNDSANPYSPFTQIMESEITNINQIVTDFLVLSKPTLHQSSSFSVIETIQEVIDEFCGKFNKREITCHLHRINQNPVLLGNKASLKQVFFNILTNSCEAIDHNGQIDITFSLTDETLCIFIQDDGNGMDEPTLTAIYQPFFSTKEHGTGLGMLISKKIIVDHKGTLEVESLQGAWTKVIIHLPLSNDSLH
ncbi:two-component system sensor histidine kinase NtrB [Sporosarcina newyorkensis]|uniref:two-component system sensor histidine kinase NtrB n=1 Tax=Sporosarcina newyorkensis TaxID=759851 RepID=UPI0002E49150|nr:ATP-binding protein [Sporosarcina newyorkensis]